ncbi:MAG: hypothetical protein GXP19_09580 [Gammaproteobacteria bacterium]|nr:hypothetical protein [Gammaproteobacteria bacterium]
MTPKSQSLRVYRLCSVMRTLSIAADRFLTDSVAVLVDPGTVKKEGGPAYSARIAVDSGFAFTLSLECVKMLLVQ